MNLANYKRPPNDNGRGLQAPRLLKWKGGAQGLDFWLGELGALGVKWLHVLDDGGNSLPLCEQLLAHEIFPIVQILRRDPAPNEGREPNPGHLNGREEDAIRQLIAAGVLYFETNSEPDRASAWKSGLKPEPNEYAAELVALNWLFDARVILDAGGYPALPALSNGENFDLLGALAKIGHLDILRAGCWLAVHNLARNRPLDFPDDAATQQGAPLDAPEYAQGELTEWAWRNDKTKQVDTLAEVNARRANEKHAGQTLAQDHACFREFEYYHSRLIELIGQPIPILSTAGGYNVGNRDDARYARITPEKHAELTIALHAFMQTRAPEYCFCALGGRLSDSSDDPNAWYGDYWNHQLANTTYQPLPVVSATLQMQKGARRVEQPIAPSQPLISNLQFPLTPDTMPSENVYVVKEGETLAGVAKKFGVTDYSLAKFNHITDASASLVGKTLIIPAPMQSPAPIPALPRKTGEGARVRRPAPPPRARSRFSMEWDLRLDALRVVCQAAAANEGEPYWKLVRAEYLDSDQAHLQHDVVFVLREENGAPVSKQTVIMTSENEKEIAETDSEGRAALTLWAGYFPERGESGAYRAQVQGASDAVAGLGLPTQNIVSFRLTFQRTRK